MNNIEKIKRIRYVALEGAVWFGFTVPIRGDQKSDSMAIIDKPVKADHNWCDLTDQGRRIVNKLITNKAIRLVEAGAFAIMVKYHAVYRADDFCQDVLDLINKTLFAGTADVAKLGARNPEDGLISWSGTRKDTVRWYGVSKSLKLDDKEKAAAVISSPVDEKNWCGLTDSARDAVNAIYAMKGVFTLWVSPFDLSIEIAPVFDWNDYHETIAAILKDKIFDGKAVIVHKAS